MTAGPTNELPPVHEAWLPKEHSLFRPRHGRRQMTALVSALVFLATPALMWVFGMRASEIENHKLAEFPSIAEGWGLFTGLDDWATDNLPFREGAVNSADWVSRTFFGEPAPFDQGGGGAPTGPLPGTPDEQQEEEPGQSDDPSAGQPHESEQAGYRDVVEGEDGWLYYGRDAWSKCEPIKPLNETIGQLATLRETVESSGRTFVLVVVPDKTTMVPEYLPDTYAGKDCADPVTPQLWQQALSIAGALDMRPRLANAAERNDRPVYYPQDTHWTNEGALEMIKGVATEIKPGIAAGWHIDQKDRTTGTADLPRLMGDEGTNQITNYRLRPDGRYDRARKSTAQLEEAKHYEAKRLPGMITQPTAVFGDSFLVAASAYLPAAFSDVTLQYYHSAQNRPADVIQTFTDAEVVVVQVVERNVAAGAIPIADQGFVDALGKELAKHPVR